MRRKIQDTRYRTQDTRHKTTQVASSLSPFTLSPFYLFTLFAFLPHSLQAQDTITLQQCIARAVEQSFDVKILQNEEAMAANNVTRGNAGYLPTVTGNANAGGSFMQWKEVSNNEQYGANISAAWTVYDGNKRSAVYRWLQELKNKSELSTRLAIETLVAEVVSIYYDLVQREITTQNIEKSMSLSHHRLKIAQENFYIGVRSRLEVLQAEVDFNADSSYYVVYLEETKQLKIKLKQLLQIPYNQDIQVADSSINLRMDLDKKTLQEKALAQNTGLLMYGKDRLLSDLERKQIEAARYPYINLNGSYGYSGATYNRSNELGLSYGITLGIKIYDGYNQRRLERNAALQQRNKELEYQRHEQQVLADLNLLFSSYRNYLELLSLEKHNSDLAAEKADLAIEQYQQGQLSSLEMREFQRTLLDAQNRYVTALYQAKYAEIRLMQICAQTQEYLIIVND